jgi:hypothetical protein
VFFYFNQILALGIVSCYRILIVFSIVSRTVEQMILLCKVVE